MVPLTGNLALGVGALSYAGQFNVTVVADPGVCPDFEVFADGVRRTMEMVAGTGGSSQRTANPSFRPVSRR
ncbi:hypothetical protein JOF56_009145 [Kibdelosporangium banguiense]|uniref:O-acyltransferase WSD1 C-terminal domain-containing protein n=2 Tax=Kibdelosporangium banguiense TaxID=1365924 RepID=A0ABS4TXR7_9PSEU|nr:WS/DGAT domain-containing protein [Kibdelosporangium banguiense]MBP2328760.1 hypothetical protein [Kibdelosporangium banguiense]